MNVKADVSHQVLDRIKGSSERLIQALNQPGVDRCFKGDPMVQQIPAQVADPESVPPKASEVELKTPVESVERVDSTGPKEESVELEMVEPVTLAESSPSLQSPYPAEQLKQEWKQMLQDVKQLQEESADSRVVLDEIRVEMGKVAAYSRREVVRLGKRLDALEQADVNAGGVETPSPELQDLSENPYLKEQQQQIESLQSTVRTLSEQLQQHTSPDPLDQSKETQFLAQQQQMERLQQQFDQLQQLIAQPQQEGGADLTFERVEQLQQQMSETEQQLEQQSESTAAIGELTAEYGEKIGQLMHSIENLEQLLQQQTAAEKMVDELTDNPLTTSDGRDKNIVEELRYEIGEVRKNSNRQLEALSSKLHALSTSSEVNQIVKHATTQLQQRIDGIVQQVEQGQKSRAVETPTIRF